MPITPFLPSYAFDPETVEVWETADCLRSVGQFDRQIRAIE
jgi:hypothetical protein